MGTWIVTVWSINRFFSLHLSCWNHQEVEDSLAPFVSKDPLMLGHTFHCVFASKSNLLEIDSPFLFLNGSMRRISEKLTQNKVNLEF